jgi:hypothetical protein
MNNKPHKYKKGNYVSIVIKGTIEYLTEINNNKVYLIRDDKNALILANESEILPIVGKQNS